MSELLFLGTGAADWEMEQRNGFFRRNSAALVNRDLLLDCGAHIFDFAEERMLPDLYRSVSHILVTHDHSDHISPESVHRLAKRQKLTIGCDRSVMERIGSHPNITYTLLKPFEKVTFGSYTVIPLLANHHIVADGENYAFHHIVKTNDGKTLFYGLDSAWFLRPSWEVMKQHRFDVMVLDCTVGDKHDWRIFEHNTIPMLREQMKEIEAQNLLAEHGVAVASHFARTLHTTHEETERVLHEFGMIAAYDGMRLEF